MTKYIEDAIKQQVCSEDNAYMLDEGNRYKCPTCGKILYKKKKIARRR
jgi:predicted RNA-binding Zn-ribbon protein involved in translation (DUF1610 family)